ncbi:DUF4097 family beta strand repeat-containing protein [Lactobacillus sp. ESL0225]|uniref:DUF4097 family beta strand repeat-containing protein n=1 Tax=Lactobacillus sp. ESL0225 TaxID=2069351 RepID=UPI000EFC7228|nr:DUF4097 family beta strand repeat-containing protein [Lactobacillus sp. ESL0225]RMC51962.1 hypothetical protein F5ESL0225_00370 [Lactobacillus sp. ESL0225]
MKKFYKICALVLVVFFLAIGLNIYHDIHTTSQTMSHFNKPNQFSNQTKRKTIVFKKFTKIKLDTYLPDIQVIPGKKYQVTIIGNYGADISKIKTSIKDNQLTIFDKPEPHYNNGNYHVEIRVPKSHSLLEISGSCYACTLLLKNLIIPRINIKVDDSDAILKNTIVKKLNLILSDGEFKVSNSTLSSAKLALSDSDCKITDSQCKITATLNDGDALIKNSKITGNSSFNLNDGDFIMNKAPKISYDLTADSEDTIKFDNTYHTSHLVKRLNGTPLLKVVSADGDIAIN